MFIRIDSTDEKGLEGFSFVEQYSGTVLILVSLPDTSGYQKLTIEMPDGDCIEVGRADVPNLIKALNASLAAAEERDNENR